MCAISGSEEYYGGGGGGGAARAKGPASGGLGGGGAGSKSESADLKNGVPGTDGLGGGGGGGGRLNDSIYLGARGGRGTVYIRLLRSPETVEPTVHEEGVATGGDVYRKRHGFGIHTFTTSGTFALTEDATVDLLMVGGGGGGGAGRGGGGGAGGVIVCTNLALQAGSYDVTVGAGGEGCLPSHTVTAENGKASSLVLGNAFVLSVPGGGAGGTGGWETKTHAVGFDGASGGGAGHYGYWGTEHPVTDGGKGMAYYGHDGGASYTGGDHFRCYGGGGGGAGEKGGDAVLNVAAGKGGDGIWCDFSGLAVCYGGGGGGGDSGRPTVGGAGGAGGGGTGGTGDIVVEGKTGYTSGSPGEDGLGGGGGGGGGYGENCGAGGKGGSGVVIIRYHLKKKGMLLIVR